MSQSTAARNKAIVFGQARAARQLGISRTQLSIRLRKHGLEGAGA